MGVAGILYGALMAFGQTDLKRLVAYTSVSHMGFVLLGIFSLSEVGMQGAVVMMLAHGIATGSLFLLAQMIRRRFGTRDLGILGGIWSAVPRLGGSLTLFAMASLGLPGLAGFVGEFLVLLAAWQVSVPSAIFAGCGLVFSAVYSLHLVQRVLHGPLSVEVEGVSDLSRLESAMLGAMIIVTVWIGLAPQTCLDCSRPAIRRALDRRPPAHGERRVR
jgi:NADH-quinone oxidoreductase subunit M